ncbi:uncharacterized protein [Palaemon carinicauda]|uniref:uncharacterized protein isoform X3 n=1 Tax=Palaemon carinicauda TaxID=392227 RepID=UPI0035B63E42
MKMENQGSGAPPARPPPPGAASAPPAYGDTPPGTYPAGQPGMPGQYAPPPYAPPGSQGPPQGFHISSPPSLYPDLSQLPEPEPVPIEVLSAGGTHPGFHPAVVGPGVPPSPTAASRLPVRPAPSPPVNVPSAPSATLEQQPHWWTTLREGEAPPDCVISWKGAKGLKIYFIQEEGHIVSPTKPLEMIVFKKIRSETGMLDEGSLGCEAKSGIVEDSLLGMIEVMGSWRLRLHGNNSFCLHTYNDVYVFLDDSTCPSKSERIVILELPHDVSKTMRSDLHALLQEMTDLREEQEGVVGKITTNVGTVYDDITKKINLAVKDVAPGAHKSTKWIRKGTGSLVRLGGNLVSKGLHIVADHIPATQPEQQEEESPLHSVLLEGLKKFQKDLESKTITYV